MLGGNLMLKSKILINKTVASPYGKVTFDKKGENNDLPVKDQEALGKLAYIDYVKDSEPKPESKNKEKNNTNSEKKEEPKKEDSKKEEKAQPKKETKAKAQPKKTVNKKTKKSEDKKGKGE